MFNISYVIFFVTVEGSGAGKALFYRPDFLERRLTLFPRANLFGLTFLNKQWPYFPICVSVEIKQERRKATRI